MPILKLLYRWNLASAAAFGLILCGVAQAFSIYSTDSHITYTPTSSWSLLVEPGSSGCGSEFLLGARDGGGVTFTFPYTSTSWSWWGYQRSDGGVAQVCVDGANCYDFSYYNASTNGSESPRLLATIVGMSNAVHTISFTNIKDPAVNAYGQLTVDRFVLDSTNAAPTFPSNTAIYTVPLSLAYHAPLILGGHSPAVEVLLDFGASDAWVISNLCNSANCQGHNAYVPSSNFHNLSIKDTEAYGDGGPGSTFVTWRVEDSLTFGSITIPQTTFGAAVQIPSGQNVDGNFGMAKSGYAHCSGGQYNNFVENMYQQGIIKNPVVAFYQLDGTENVPAGVTSQASIGGLDANKFTGDVDWIPMDPQGMWVNPQSTRWVQLSSTSAWGDVTAHFTHPAIIFDTGDPGLLGVPHGDWLTLMSLLGAIGPDSNTNYRIPCESAMAFNFQGTQNRAYAFYLADMTTNTGGFCSPLANDSGNDTNWITGVPFLHEYYVAFHYSANLIGFATRNLALSAAGSSPYIS
ncbi:acid protease [Calocera viscosa TUFC12733]|uniref:Acid protease n=1 Tax=Calocera viscosa (strain TUFC12733) TaxID=1330018 RepID=A0A167LGT7_CALVF|nr:acid protease [Calocera viscosa TUFC12733]